MIIENVLQNKDLMYKEYGADFVIQCLSPEHKDSTPSLRVDKDTGAMHCFSCGFKGNLLKHFNIELTREDREVFALKKRISELEMQVSGVKLPPNLTPIQRREIRGIEKKYFNELGAFTHDSFGDRICFPVMDNLGIVRYVITRANDPAEKVRYLVYPSGHGHTMLYPQQIKPYKDSIIFVEGVFDMLSLRRSGLKNIQALQGVSLLNDKSAKKMLTYIDILGITRIYLMMDNDEAGKKATEKISELIRTYTNATPIPVQYVGSDPGDMTRKRVNQTLKKLYKEQE